MGFETHLVKKHALGGMMNEEEARMNRELLREISNYKKFGASTKQSSCSPTNTSMV